ncbi:MAG: segregation/condensation protein A, partial [Gammaproteobacteria bacterium]|nr:segregation/condensation protein A [Gammaproteobacteria bacterium]
SHDVVIETMTVHAQMNSVLDLLRVANEYLEFNELFDTTKGRRGLVYTFLALLELLRRNLVEAVQNNPTSAIYVRAVEAG